MTDLMTLLDAARPTEEHLESELTDVRRDRIAARIAASRDQRVAPSRRRPAAWLAAAALTGALVVLPSVARTDRAAVRADLTELSMAAVRDGGPGISEGTFLHVKTEAVQRNSRLFGDGRTLDTHREEWIRWDGKTWAIDTRPSAGWREYAVFPPSESFTPERAAALPRTARDLRAYLDRTVSGSNSHDEAVYVAITDWVRSNLLPPRTLAAALAVLADVDGVETKDVTVRGRDAVEVSFHRFWTGLVSTQSMTIDRATARTLAERDSDPGGTYELDVTMVQVVRDLPTAVRQQFADAGNGKRVYDDGHTPTPDEL